MADYESSFTGLQIDAGITRANTCAENSTANDTDANLKKRANHTGTQTASTISDFDTEVSNNTNVAANTSARHNAVTVSDTNTLNLTLTGQEIEGEVLGVKDTNTSTGGTFVEFYTCTQAEYDAIGTPGTNTLYIITT